MFNIVSPKTTDRQRYTFAQAAVAMGVSRQIVYRWVSQGRIASHNYMGKKCIYVEDAIKPKAITPTGNHRKKGQKDKVKRKRIGSKKVKRTAAYHRSRKSNG